MYNCTKNYIICREIFFRSCCGETDKGKETEYCKIIVLQIKTNNQMFNSFTMEIEVFEKM